MTIANRISVVALAWMVGLLFLVIIPAEAQTAQTCEAQGGTCITSTKCPWDLPRVIENRSNCLTPSSCCAAGLPCMGEEVSREGFTCSDRTPRCCDGLLCYELDEEQCKWKQLDPRWPAQYVCVTKKVAKCSKPIQQQILEAAAKEAPKDVYFTPQVTIPGSITIGGKEFVVRRCEPGEDVSKCGIKVTGDTIAQYFALWYRFFVAALAVIAIVMVMWGGFKRIMAAGSPERVKSANETIIGAITGVIIALISYTLLSLINPALVSFKSLDIYQVLREEWEGEQSDSLTETGGNTASVGFRYKQCDPAWGSMAYTESNNDDCTLCSSGCGVASVATVLASYGVNVTPRDVGEYAIQIGARTDCSGGTKVYKLVQQPASEWGVQTETIKNFDEAMQRLEQGQKLITSIRRMPVEGKCKINDCGDGVVGVCFCGGHLIVLEGKTGNTITVFDPSRVDITSLDVDTLKKYISYIEFYRFWK